MSSQNCCIKITTQSQVFDMYVHRYIIYVTPQLAKTPMNKLPAANHPKTSKLSISNISKNRRLYVGSYALASNKFSYLGFFTKVSIPA